ncbi:hypothetical protein REPUB_Repub06bG0047700 [Reevesia pubescens]
MDALLVQEVTDEDASNVFSSAKDCMNDDVHCVVEGQKTLRVYSILGVSFVDSQKDVVEVFRGVFFLSQMKLICWNIRSLERKEKRRTIHRINSEWKPDVLMLQETKLNVVDKKLLRALGFYDEVNFEFSSSEGSSGELILIWKNIFFDIEFKIISRRYIVVIGSIKPLKLKCGLVNVYASNDDGERSFSWDEIFDLLKFKNLPWIFGGDFNVIRFMVEKIGAGYNFGAMASFNDFIEKMELVDLPLLGGMFTWFNNHEEATFCRLDRFLVSTKILEKCNNLAQKLLPRSLSNHNLLLLYDDEVD